MKNWLLACFILSLLSCSGSPDKIGIIRVKVDDGLARILEGDNMVYNYGINTGNADFDSAMEDIRASSLSRTFSVRPESEYEGRLREERLHLWYDIYYDGSMSKQYVVERLSSVNGISSVECVSSAIISKYKFENYKK